MDLTTKICKKRRRRLRRHKRVRKKIYGTPERPRICIYRSLKHIYAQIVDDAQGKTLTTVSSLSPEVRAKIKRGDNIEAARMVGELLGKKAQELGIKRVVFDRAGYKYHGRVKTLAESARKAGLEF